MWNIFGKCEEETEKSGDERNRKIWKKKINSSKEWGKRATRDREREEAHTWSFRFSVFVEFEIFFLFRLYPWVVWLFTRIKEYFPEKNRVLLSSLLVINFWFFFFNFCGIYLSFSWRWNYIWLHFSSIIFIFVLIYVLLSPFYKKWLNLTWHGV